MEQLAYLDPKIIGLDHLRRIRKELVHGIKIFPSAYLHEAEQRLEALIEQIERRGGVQ
jgi:hypothetical protein